jgi:hypothetical protein
MRYDFTPDTGAKRASQLPPLPVRTPATIRPDWTMPPPPPGGPWHAVVHDTGDGWCTSWEGAEGDEGELIVGEIGWPFVEDEAGWRDWERAGWVVV